MHREFSHNIWLLKKAFANGNGGSITVVGLGAWHPFTCRHVSPAAAGVIAGDLLVGTRAIAISYK